MLIMLRVHRFASLVHQACISGYFWNVPNHIGGGFDCWMGRDFAGSILLADNDNGGAGLTLDETTQLYMVWRPVSIISRPCFWACCWINLDRELVRPSRMPLWPWGVWCLPVPAADQLLRLGFA